MTAARFISLEGGEGAGKSTALANIEKVLRETGIEFIRVREPGGTAIGESIRQVLLQDHDHVMAAETELLLMFASRAQLLAEKIKPALENGIWVVSDRFVDASFAYQVGGRDIAKDRYRYLQDWIVQQTMPDLTLLLDVPPVIGLQRAAGRGEKDRIEKEADAFFLRVQHAYLQLAQAQPQRIKLINAEQSIEKVSDDIIQVLQGFIQNLRQGA